MNHAPVFTVKQRKPERFTSIVAYADPVHTWEVAWWNGRKVVVPLLEGGPRYRVLYWSPLPSSKLKDLKALTQEKEETA